MRFEIDRCPNCGNPPKWISEWLSTQYEIEDEGDGIFEYTGNHDDGSFESKLDLDRRRRVQLACEDGHDWRTRLLRERNQRVASK
jgi:hypothetical protein